MSISNILYQRVFKKTSTMALTMVIGAVIFEKVFDEGIDTMWEKMNRGVSRFLHSGSSLVTFMKLDVFSEESDI